MPIVKRTTKGAALTHLELDGNFDDLDGRVTAAAAVAAAKQSSLGVADATALNALVDTRANTVVATATSTLAPAASLSVLPVNDQTGTAYTLALADAGVLVKRTNASGNTTTVPPNSVIGFPIGTVIQVMQGGTGTVTIVPGSGVTLLKPTARTLAVSAQYESVSLHKHGTDTWVVVAS